MTLDEQISGWESRLEELLVDMTRARNDEGKAIRVNTYRIAESFRETVAEIRGIPIVDSPAIQKMLRRACMDVDNSRVVKAPE